MWECVGDPSRRILFAVVAASAAMWFLCLGCAPNQSSWVSPTVSPPQTMVSPVAISNGATVSYPSSATPSQVEDFLAVVGSFVEHWAPIGLSPPLRIRFVPQDTLWENGVPLVGYRHLETGEVWLTYDETGFPSAAWWEIALEEQQQYDPPIFSRGLWGPLFPRQNPVFAKATEE